MIMNSKGLLNQARLSGGAIALLAVIASPAFAAPIRVQARQDQSVQSSFVLDFGAQGGVSSALISRTEMELEIDGLAGSARFVSYDQDIDALTLPGGLSTGAIRVQIVPDSSTGTYDRATGAFTTNELYSIEFEGDLSTYGLTSPVILPSQSVGVVNVDSSTVGHVTMNWAGENVDSPTVPIDFSYICSLFATFATTADSYIELEMVPLLDGIAMPSSLKARLLSNLNSALASLQNDDDAGAIAALRKFIAGARNNAPLNIASADSTALVSAANTAIAMIGGTVNPGVFSTGSSLPSTSIGANPDTIK